MVTIIFPPLLVYFRALERRLEITLSKLALSIQTIIFSVECMKMRSIPFAVACTLKRSMICLLYSINSVSCICILICSLSIFLISIIWFMRRRMRSAFRFIEVYIACRPACRSSFISCCNGNRIKVIGVRISWEIFMKNCSFCSCNNSAFLCSCNFNCCLPRFITCHIKNRTSAVIMAMYNKRMNGVRYHGLCTTMRNSFGDEITLPSVAVTRTR